MAIMDNVDDAEGAPLFRPIPSRRTFEDAVAQIADAISSGELRIGQRLPSERLLAAQMEISRATVRQALSVLATAGMIDLTGEGRGARPVVVSDFVPASLVAGEVKMRASDVAGVLVTRRILEPRVVQLAAVHGTADNFARMEHLNEVLQDAATAGNRSRFLQADLRFHREISHATGNKTIEAVMKVFLRELERAYDLALRTPTDPEWHTVVDDHRRILEAVSARDPDEAESRMLKHIATLERYWESESGSTLHRKLPDFVMRNITEAG